ncbi:MAG: formate dehydrogenase accessory protein FdhE [Firmicutes bacterium]|nr:formate dehydrogenase accessory protein FdhE [Bacillota bacterium]
MLQCPIELIRLTSEVGELQKDYTGVADLKPPQESLYKVHLQEGVPWLKLYSIDLPKSELLAYYVELKSLLAKYPPFSFLGELGFEQILPFACRCLKGELSSIREAAAKIGASPASLQFFLQELLRPSFKSWAAFFRDYLSQDDWRLSICPVCGHLPIGGRHEKKEGHRYLLCSHCETEWRFNRVTCISCYNDDHKTLGYFTVEDVGNWRVSFCRQCNSYIKEVIGDEPANIIDFELAMQLDILAKKEGFEPVKM